MPFDYSRLDDNVKAIVLAATEHIHKQNRTQVEAIIAIGKELIEVKQALKHGQFGKWLRCEFGWSRRSAQNYMSAARVFGDKSATVAHLQPTTVYALSAPKIPESVRRAALGILDAEGQVDDRQLMSRALGAALVYPGEYHPAEFEFLQGDSEDDEDERQEQEKWEQWIAGRERKNRATFIKWLPRFQKTCEKNRVEEERKAGRDEQERTRAESNDTWAKNCAESLADADAFASYLIDVLGEDLEPFLDRLIKERLIFDYAIDILRGRQPIPQIMVERFQSEGVEVTAPSLDPKVVEWVQRSSQKNKQKLLRATGET